MWWMILICVVALGVVLVGIYGVQTNHRLRSPEEEERDRQHAEYEAARDDLFSGELAEFRITKCRVRDSQAILALGDGEEGLVFIRYQDHPLQSRFKVHSREVIEWSNISGVEVATPERTETYWRERTIPVVVQKNKNAIVRGAVGAFVLGPAGLILGAASAIAPETKVSHEKIRTRDVRTVRAQPTLTLVFSDSHREPLKITFEQSADAEILRKEIISSIS